MVFRQLLPDGLPQRRLPRMSIDSQMPHQVRNRFEAELTSARTAASAGAVDAAWTALGVAHVLSQPWWGPHVRVHWRMLGLGLRSRDRREVRGQLLRLVVAGPGSMTGRYPKGNTGRSDVPATLSMPVSQDLEELLDAATRR